MVNTPCAIDSDYRMGEVMVAMINLSAEEQVINDGDRIAQLVVAKHETVSWTCVDVLDDTLRGAGGFGHSGTI